MNDLKVIEDDQWTFIRESLMDTDRAKYNDTEVKLFVFQCNKTGLDPRTRQIYVTKINGKMSIQATVDGLRVIAERSNKYSGQTRPVWFSNSGEEFRIWPSSRGLPYACEVGVMRSDFKEPLFAIAIFDEYAQRINGKLGFMWEKMPALMISKVAESLALRKAFPNDMSGIYSKEEMHQAENSLAEPREVNSQLKISQPKLKNYADEIKITREQADIIKYIGEDLSMTTDEISKLILDRTGKKKWGEISMTEFDSLLLFLKTKLKSLQKELFEKEDIGVDPSAKEL